MQNIIYKSRAKETEKKQNRKIKRQNKFGTMFYIVAGIVLFSFALLSIVQHFA